MTNSGRLLLAVLVWIHGAGCNCGQGSAPANGIYLQSATTLSDTCTPRACEGDAGLAAVTTTSEGSVRIPVAHCFGGRREHSTQYQGVPLGYDVRNSCGAIIGKESVTVEQVGPPLTVRVTTHLDGGECASDGGAVWPTSACALDQRLTFDLVQECQPPCTMTLDQDGGNAITCSCP